MPPIYNDCYIYFVHFENAMETLAKRQIFLDVNK